MKVQETIRFRSIALACALLFGLCTVAAAQRRAPVPQAAPQGTQHPKSTPSAPRAGAERKGEERGEAKPFAPGVAKHLGMTEEAVESTYQAALKANPKLTRGQFIAANILAKNLGSKDSKITTQAILDGLASGKSIGQTLKRLGLSADEAKAAERQADREAREAREKTGNE